MWNGVKSFIIMQNWTILLLDGSHCALHSPCYSQQVKPQWSRILNCIKGMVSCFQICSDVQKIFFYSWLRKTFEFKAEKCLRWDERLIGQASDVPNIIFFLISYRLRALKTLYFYFCKLKQFLVTEFAFLTCSWRFLMSQKLEQL